MRDCCTNRYQVWPVPFRRLWCRPKRPLLPMGCFRPAQSSAEFRHQTRLGLLPGCTGVTCQQSKNRLTIWPASAPTFGDTRSVGELFASTSVSIAVGVVLWALLPRGVVFTRSFPAKTADGQILVDTWKIQNASSLPIRITSVAIKGLGAINGKAERQSYRQVTR